MSKRRNCRIPVVPYHPPSSRRSKKYKKIHYEVHMRWAPFLTLFFTALYCLIFWGFWICVALAVVKYLFF